MTTITIQIPDEEADKLIQEATRLSIPVEELAVRRLLSPWKPTEEQSTDMDFDATLNYVFEKNSELYRRLA